MNIHQLSVEAALASLRTGAQGLTSAEAARRLDEFGPNRIERVSRVPLALRLAHEFTHFFAIVLWAAALLAFITDVRAPGQGMRALALAIVAVVVINGLFSFWQEYRAEEAFHALQALLPQDVTTLRNGRAARMPAERLVPGDVIIVDAGDSLSTDCRVIESFALRVDMSTVTGESRPVARDAEADRANGLLHSRNALLAGTTVVSGNARAVVVATGMRTEFGQIARLAQTTEEAPSPLRLELTWLSRVIAVLALTVGALVFAIGETSGLSQTATWAIVPPIAGIHVIRPRRFGHLLTGKAQ